MGMAKILDEPDDNTPAPFPTSGEGAYADYRRRLFSLKSVSSSYQYQYTVSQKRDPDVIDCNFEKD